MKRIFDMRAAILRYCSTTRLRRYEDGFCSQVNAKKKDLDFWVKRDAELSIVQTANDPM